MNKSLLRVSGVRIRDCEKRSSVYLMPFLSVQSLPTNIYYLDENEVKGQGDGSHLYWVSTAGGKASEHLAGLGGNFWKTNSVKFSGSCWTGFLELPPFTLQSFHQIAVQE